MTIAFELLIAADVQLPAGVRAAVAGVLEGAGVHLPQTAAGLITIELVSEQRIIELHREFFADDSPTDVITFPGGDADSWVGGFHDSADRPTAFMLGAHLGDIAICVPVAVEQAREAGQSSARELAFLALHGALHLLGFNDETDEERAAMLALQEQILSAAEGQRGAL